MNAHFTITGAFITQQVRAFILEDEPGKAYRLLDCVSGEGNEAMARRLLAGEVILTGDSVEGIEVSEVDAGDEDAAEYVENMRYLYAGRVRLDKCWYRPRAVITSWGQLDARAALEIMRSVPTKLDDVGTAVFSRLRAEYYAAKGERVELVSGQYDNQWVVFESCGEPPQWRKPATTADEAMIESVAASRPLDELGAHVAPRHEVEQVIKARGLVDEEADAARELAYAEEDARLAMEHKRIGMQVRAQAGDDVFEMTLQDQRVVKVPRAPFTHWALGRLDPVPALPEWAPVSMPGLKMNMDNPHHTDWVLGAGLTLDECYEKNVTGPAWEHASELQFAEVDRA